MKIEVELTAEEVIEAIDELSVLKHKEVIVEATNHLDDDDMVEIIEYIYEDLSEIDKESFKDKLNGTK